MSFNKYFIPEPADLAAQIQKNGPTSVVRRKIDAIIGNSTSVKIFDHAYELMHEGKADPEILESLSSKFPTYFT
jgi:3-hydroxyacyl-CoA dehydrogenase